MRVDAVQAAQLRELKEQRGKKAGERGLPPAGAKQVAGVEAHGEREQDVEERHVYGRHREEPAPGARVRGRQAARLGGLRKVAHERERLELGCGGVGHKRRAALWQRQDDQVVRAQGIEQQREHHEALPRRDGAVASILKDHVRNEKHERGSRKRHGAGQHDSRISAHAACLPWLHLRVPSIRRTARGRTTELGCVVQIWGPATLHERK